MSYFARHFLITRSNFNCEFAYFQRHLKITGIDWNSQEISLNSLTLVKFYICKPKSTRRGSLIKKQTII
jgi:hypothetical protein